MYQHGFSEQYYYGQSYVFTFSIQQYDDLFLYQYKSPQNSPYKGLNEQVGLNKVTLWNEYQKNACLL